MTNKREGPWMRCAKCRIWFELSALQEHHIYPKELRESEQNIKDGRRILLCKEDHIGKNGLHYIPEYIEARKRGDKDGIWRITERFIGKTL